MGFLVGIVLSIAVGSLSVYAENPRDREHAPEPAPVDNALEVKLNRVRTEHGWAGIPIKFPCQEEIDKRKKRGEQLSFVVIHGERHDHPYCLDRKKQLYSMAHSPTSQICLADEGDIAPVDSSPDKKVVKGLENKGIKELDALLISYESLKSTLPLEEYAANFPVGHLLQRQPGIDLLKKDANDSKEVARLKKKLLDKKGQIESLDKLATKLRAARAATPIDFPVPTFPNVGGLYSGLGQVFDTWLKQLPSKDVALFQEFRNLVLNNKPIVAELFKKAATTMAEKISNQQKTREDVAVPLDLDREVRYALQTIDQAAKSPQDALCRNNVRDCGKYRKRWRDRLMAVNLAIAYCENLAQAKPKPEVHAIVGNLHRQPMRELLGTSARQNEIPLYGVDGVHLAKMHDLFKGQPDENGRYPNRGVEPVILDGKIIGLAIQKDGVRVVLQSSKLDPMPGSLLNGQGLKSFGRPADREAFIQKTGLRGDSAVENAGKISQQLVDLYESKDRSVDSVSWFPREPLVAPVPRMPYADNRQPGPRKPAVAEKPKSEVREPVEAERPN